MTRAEIERVNRKPPGRLDAYDYWLRGLAADRQYTREGREKAIALFEQAVKLDPRFALAQAMLANALQRGGWGWSNDPASDASRSVEYARIALALDRSDPLVLTYSAMSLMFAGGEVEFSHSLFEEAIRLDPNGVLAWIWGGWAKILLGDHHTAVKYVQRALRLNPIDPRVAYAEFVLAYAHFFLGNYEEGLRFAASHRRRIPTHLAGLRIEMACNAFLGNTEMAKSLWREHAALSPGRVSNTPKRFRGRPQDVAKLQEAYRLAGMPE